MNAAPTKAVYDLSVNPHNNNYLLSHVDNQITIWDTRWFEKAVLTLSQGKPVTKVLWCPTRHNLLGALQKDSGIFIFNVKNVLSDKIQIFFFFGFQWHYTCMIYSIVEWEEERMQNLVHWKER